MEERIAGLRDLAPQPIEVGKPAVDHLRLQWLSEQEFLGFLRVTIEKQAVLNDDEGPWLGIEGTWRVNSGIQQRADVCMRNRFFAKETDRASFVDGIKDTVSAVDKRISIQEVDGTIVRLCHENDYRGRRNDWAEEKVLSARA